MKLKLPRYRWLLLVAVAGLASWLLWPKSAMREKYERIRLGMTRTEVSQLMGRESNETPGDSPWVLTSGMWEIVASQPPPTEQVLFVGDDGFWCDGNTGITTSYLDGKVGNKVLYVRMTPLEVRLREWLQWLRGFVGR